MIFENADDLKQKNTVSHEWVADLYILNDDKSISIDFI